MWSSNASNIKRVSSGTTVNKAGHRAAKIKIVYSGTASKIVYTGKRKRVSAAVLRVAAFRPVRSCVLAQKLIPGRACYVAYTGKSPGTRYRAFILAAAVSARSPPESKASPCCRLPGGRATMSIPVPIRSSGSVSCRRADPPPNNFSK